MRCLTPTDHYAVGLFPRGAWRWRSDSDRAATPMYMQAREGQADPGCSVRRSARCPGCCQVGWLGCGVEAVGASMWDACELACFIQACLAHPAACLLCLALARQA